jgi:AcrR family transcriptional regulator
MVLRKTRAEATESNRAAVLASARRQFEQRGFHGATLESIAEEAGFSKGVVYSRFGSKDDLFLALLEQNIERRHRRVAEQFESLRGPANLSRLAEISIRENAASMAWQVALLEFRAHAWRSPALNERYRAVHRRTVESIAGFIADLYVRAGELPPADLEHMAVVGLAAGTGAVTELMADPSLDVSLFTDNMPAALASVASSRERNER